MKRLFAFCLVLISAVTIIERETGFAAEKNGRSAPVSRQQVDALIEKLGDDDYHARQLAQDKIERLGFEAFDALGEAENHADPEVAARVRYLLRLLQVDFADQSDSQRVRDILRRYRSKPTDEKIQSMQALAKLPKGEGLTALCRLVRFQRSAILSKYAAAAILQWQMDNRDLIARADPLIRQQLSSSKRESSRWVRESLRFQSDPKRALAKWIELIYAERNELYNGGRQTDAKLLKQLMRYELDWVFALGLGNEEKTASIKRLVSTRSGSAEKLQQIVPWLVAIESWKALKQSPTEFVDHLAAKPQRLLYEMAEVFATQGKPDLAEQAAEHAFEVSSKSSVMQQQSNLETAYLLQRKGHVKWAEREYRRCLKHSGDNPEIALVAGSYLAEMMHDRADNLEAAEVLDQVIGRMDVQKQTDAKKFARLENILSTSLKSIVARRNYFMAEHYKIAGDSAKERQFLEEALDSDPSEIDVLIACYRLRDTSPAFRAKVKKHIRETVGQMRLMALNNSQLPTYYNQLAWLVANTEGDLDEAIRFSQKSLMLQRDSGGYYDTLARCYYAKGDMKNALKAQTKAAQLEPHSVQIAKQLEVIKKAAKNAASAD